MTSTTDLLSSDDDFHPTINPHSSPALCYREVSKETREEMQSLSDCVPQIKQHFSLMNKIGSGTFSSVFAARSKVKGQKNSRVFALKHIIPTSHPNRIVSELKCLQQVGGQSNVMGVEACLRHRDHVVIIMPFFHHERFNDYRLELDTEEIRLYIFNLLVALRHVHKAGIIHRDVKPSNFLFNRKLKKFSLVDFGLADMENEKDDRVKKEKKSPAKNKTPVIPSRVQSHVEPTSKKRRHSEETTSANKRARQQSPPSRLAEIDVNQQSTSRPITTVVHNRHGQPLFKSVRPVQCRCHGHMMICCICNARGSQNASRAGTPGFRAPEVLLKCPKQGTALDVWSAGIIFLCFLSSRYPFFKAPDDLSALAQVIHVFGTEAVQKAAHSYGKWVGSNPIHQPLNLQAMCQNLQEVSLNFPTEAYDLLSKLLHLDPQQRISAQDALGHPYFNGLQAP